MSAAPNTENSRSPRHTFTAEQAMAIGPSNVALVYTLLDHGIPVVVVKPDGRTRQSGWQRLSAEDCDLRLYRPGDALAMVTGHGLDVVDVDTKAKGSVENLPPFKSYGEHRTPSGGGHYLVPSSGLGKMTLTTADGHVGDYLGGCEDGSSRALCYLPGSRRAKYPGLEYAVVQEWAVEAALAASPDPDLYMALEAAGGKSESPYEPQEADTSEERDPALGVSYLARWEIDRIVERLHECSVLGWDGPPWNNTTFGAACDLIKLANANWSGLTHDGAHALLMQQAPRDQGFDEGTIQGCWDSATGHVADRYLELPFPPWDGEEVGDDGLTDADRDLLARFAPLDLRALLDPDRPERQYVIDPMISEGASVSFVAQAGHRKSLLALGISVAVARGDGEWAGMTIPCARRVLYIDMENTEDDLAERLTDLGLSIGEVPANLTVVSMPDMDSLDTAKGGKDLLRVVRLYGLREGDLLVLDSYQRITEGAENDSDTTRAFYRHTGRPLKARKITVLRTDNTGHGTKSHARGSSGKKDDVDIEYLLKADGDYVNVKHGKLRQKAAPEMSILVGSDDAGRITFRSDLPSPDSRRVTELIALLDQLGVPVNAGERKVKEALLAAGKEIPSRDQVLRPALKIRKAPGDDFR